MSREKSTGSARPMLGETAAAMVRPMAATAAFKAGRSQNSRADSTPSSRMKLTALTTPPIEPRVDPKTRLQTVNLD
jgi:hypothetical protein